MLKSYIGTSVTVVLAFFFFFFFFLENAVYVIWNNVLPIYQREANRRNSAF